MTLDPKQKKLIEDVDKANKALQDYVANLDNINCTDAIKQATLKGLTSELSDQTTTLKFSV